MARRRKAVRYYEQPKPKFIKDAPTESASADVLRTHYMFTNGERACYSYDTIRQYCYWCFKDALEYPDEGVRQGTHKWCSKQCRDAMAAYRAKVYGKVGAKSDGS